MIPLVGTIQAMADVGSQCGTKICEVSQFCSKFHLECEDCSKVCDLSNHNFDSVLCKTECTEYLHDQSYVKKSDYEAEIRSLKLFSLFSMSALFLLFLLFFIVNGKKMYLWIRKCTLRRITTVPKASKNATTLENHNTDSPNLGRKNITLQNVKRTSSIFTVSGTEYDQKTVSTPISRHPAEDTVDYFYDNKALQLTPVGEEKRKSENNF